MAWAPASSYKGGIFQWTLGQSYKTSLGGNFSTSIGQNSAVSVAAESKFTLGTTNSVKYAWETSVSFGKSFSYKDVDEIEFKPSGISIAEASGARCLDLFQASAGLGPIQRGAFEAQRSAARQAMKILVICNGASAIANILMSGFGQGFAEQGKTDQQSHYALEVGIAVTAAQALTAIIPVVMLLCNSFLTAAKAGTKPTTWQPNAILQTSSTKGVFIGAGGLNIAPRASMMQMDESGTTLTVFNTPFPTLLGEDIGLLDKKEHISTYDLTPASGKSTMKMTEDSLDIKTGRLSLLGMTGTDIIPIRQDTTLKAVFSSIDLCAQNDFYKRPPNASLVLNAGEATLSAVGVAPAISSVVATQTDLTLKSGAKTSLVLDAEGATLRGPVSVGIISEGSIGLRGLEVTIQGRGSLVLRSPLVKLG